MAVGTYTLRRGDNIWNLANGNYGADYRNAIPGNTTNAKVDYLIKLNNIADTRKMPVGYIVYLNEAAKNGTSSASSSAQQTASKVTITTLALQSESDTGRDFFASWSWSREHTAGYTVRWEWDYNGETKSQTTDNVTDTWSTFSIPEDFRSTANWVQIFVKPVAENKDTTDGSGNTTQVPYWTDVVETGKQYFIKDNPPIKISEAPNVEINKETMVLTASYSNIVASELDAVSVKFNIVQDNSVSLGNFGPYTINTVSNYVACQQTVERGHTYTVRACTVGGNGKTSGWSGFSESKETQPSAPTGLSVRRDTHVDEGNGIKTYSVFAQWSPVPNATKYKVEYTNVENDFNVAGITIPSATTEDSSPSIRIKIDSQDLGYKYYFRVRAINKSDDESGPSEIVELPIGVPPGPPTTWSTSDSAFVGETMELNWMHNPSDNSKQTYAQISFNFNDEKDSAGEFIWNDLEVMVNSTDANDTEEVTKKYTYGTSVSYKGNLYFKMDTNHPDFKNTKIQWKVRTAGVDDILSNDSWSLTDTIHIYEKPTLGLSMTSDLSGNNIVETLTTFPFYVRGKLSLTDYSIQRPVGYHLQIISNNYYVTVDDVGRTKIINPGDAVYSKYFNTSETLVVEMSANNIDLESSIDYTIQCTADMSTGLAVYNQYDFTVSWVDVEYTINADISIDKEAYTALITPYCREKIPTVVGEGDDAYITYEDGNLIDNVTLSIYRREYDGSYKEIASGIPNNYTSVTDPHPALDYARYRFTAKDTRTGALSFWDMTGCPVNGSAVVIQWAEEWSTFDTGEPTINEGPSWSGSLLKIPYNIKVTDKRNTEVSLINYAGRKHPVSYYGTQVNETSQWSVEIPKDDKDTIYALRRLSLWSGDVYVREPSGMGYWANVTVSFNQAYNDVKIPITFDITRVEGGV